MPNNGINPINPLGILGNLLKYIVLYEVLETYDNFILHSTLKGNGGSKTLICYGQGQCLLLRL